MPIMGEIEITENVTSEYATRVLQHYLLHYSVDEARAGELYRSPDMTKVLLLKQIDEIPWGPSIYSGEVRTLTNERAFGTTGLRFGSRRFLSPGAFGLGYDHWSGSPWSADSRHLALVETMGPKYETSRLIRIDCEGYRRITVMEITGVLGHHMWSSSRDYLFRDMTRWYLHSHNSKKVDIVYTGRAFPKHCYFDHSGERVILLDDDLRIRILAIDSLKQIATASMKRYLRKDEAISFSVPDPFEDRVLLGTNARFGEQTTSDKWLAVKARA